MIEQNSICIKDVHEQSYNQKTETFYIAQFKKNDNVKLLSKTRHGYSVAHNNKIVFVSRVPMKAVLHYNAIRL